MQQTAVEDFSHADCTRSTDQGRFIFFSRRSNNKSHRPPVRETADGPATARGDSKKYISGGKFILSSRHNEEPQNNATCHRSSSCKTADDPATERGDHIDRAKQALWTWWMMDKPLFFCQAAILYQVCCMLCCVLYIFPVYNFSIMPGTRGYKNFPPKIGAIGMPDDPATERGDRIDQAKQAV